MPALAVGAPVLLDAGLKSAEPYHAVVDALVESGVVLDWAMLYWWVRPSAAQPTLEIWIGDVAATVDEAVLVAALVRGVGRHRPRRPAADRLRASRQREAHRRRGRLGDVADLLARQTVGEHHPTVPMSV